MADIKQTRYSRLEDSIDASCRECKRSTKHTVHSGVMRKGRRDTPYEGVFQWTDHYQIIQCLGCEAIGFRRTHENTEDWIQVGRDDYELDVSVDLYPNPEQGRNEIDDTHLLPPNLQRIYSETVKSINVDQPVLTGIGIRAIVETVCKDKEAAGKVLFRKIDNLVAQGVLTEDGATTLHKLRTLGNDSAHEVKPHDNVQLGLALDVIDHLIQGVYILPHHAKSKFR